MQATWRIKTGEIENLIASHEVEDQIAEAAKIAGKEG